MSKLWLIWKFIMGLLSLFKPKSKRQRKDAHAEKADKIWEQMEALTNEMYDITLKIPEAMRTDHDEHVRLDGLREDKLKERKRLKRSHTYHLDRS